MAVLTFLLLLAAPLQVYTALSASEHLAEGDKFLAKAEFSTALDHYHAACSADAKNYQAFYKRATAYLALGRTKQAVKDLDVVLNFDPAFDQARKRRAELHAKHGKFDSAKEDYKTLGQEQYADKLQAIEQAVAHAHAAREALKKQEAAQAVAHFGEAIKIAGSDADLRMERGEAHMLAGQTGEAIGDFMRAAKLKSGNTRAYFLLSQLYYKMGERTDALTNIRECVKLDADDKECFDFYKMLKKFNKAMDKLDAAVNQNRFAEALMHMEKARKLENTEPFYVTQFINLDCRSQSQMSNSKEALLKCGVAIEHDPNNALNYMHRARAHEQMDDFQASVADFQKAHELDGENTEIRQGLERAQKLLKNSNKRDYYKILGVARNADKRTITKAYRKLAQEWHPDKFESEADKATAEVKFMDIASAKEVLTDPEKRQMFDNGEDPLDAEEERDRQSRGGHPFRGGFNPFGGGQRFNFKFQ